MSQPIHFADIVGVTVATDNVVPPCAPLFYLIETPTIPRKGASCALARGTRPPIATRLPT